MTLQVINCSTLLFNTKNVFGIDNDNIISLSLRSSRNCSSITTTSLLSQKDDVVESFDTAEEGTNFTLTAEQLGLDSFCEGVYFFEWTVTYTDENDAQVRSVSSICTLIDCEDKIKCKIVDNYLENKNDEVIFLYQALQFINECDNCNCTESCKIYKKLSNLLNLNTNGVYQECSVC